MNSTRDICFLDDVTNDVCKQNLERKNHRLPHAVTTKIRSWSVVRTDRARNYTGIGTSRSTVL